MITVNRLIHRYPHSEKNAVDDISFHIEKGEIFGFLGPSGAGKSTVQNILTGLLPLQSGNVTINGNPIQKRDRRFFEEIGVSFEVPNLYEKLTGLENLLFYATLFRKAGLPPETLMDRVELADAKHKRVKDYSKGMKQRLTFARSLINDPKILFLDEPLSGLDPATGQTVKRLIEEQREKKKTIFLTTHNMFLADELCDRVAFLHEGRIVALDTPKHLKLSNGQQIVDVEYVAGTGTEKKRFSLNDASALKALSDCVQTNKIVTMHTMEATLEQVFIQLTGRGLD
ncbi:MAG TPA: ABC transporter ATP-binding protein [Thermotogota bacterium]|nr:ABC transporter ATP-binding protein [Thermotogota bacterium]HPH10641.1 ABC transporter ATP-binding protein [Thermotogota bacterium]HPM20899.1 ABC transporter ATP-binding protein [Thermotogota bacterium]